MISAAARTHRGNIRKINEDSILNHPNYHLYAVADGMGGHTAGDLISQAIISALAEMKLEEDNPKLAIKQIETTLVNINQKINDGEVIDNLEGVAGSTIVIAYISENLCSCLWVGDSRLYIYRNERLYQITKDHSLVQEMIDGGQLSYEDANGHPKSNVITRALGVSEHLQVDINQFEIEPGDILLLCSDGLYKEINSSVIINSLQETHAEMMANNLLGEVLIRNAVDNVSLIVLNNE